MGLGGCRECGKQVSSEAKSCPHCGVDSPILPVRTAFDTFKALIQGSIVLCLFLIAANIFLNVREAADMKEQAEQRCLTEHSLTPNQVAVREHFNKCWKYRHTPSSVWSDNQRRIMLLGESCYSDDRDDPHYADAGWDLCKTR
jgi:hypothetical protein